MASVNAFYYMAMFLMSERQDRQDIEAILAPHRARVGDRLLRVNDLLHGPLTHTLDLPVPDWPDLGDRAGWVDFERALEIPERQGAEAYWTVVQRALFGSKRLNEDDCNVLFLISEIFS